MNETMIDVLAAILNIVIIAITGVLAGWVWGYMVGFRRATNKKLISRDVMELKSYIGKHFLGPFTEIVNDVYIPGLRDLAASRHIEDHCPECGAPVSNHCPGCPKDTIAKPGG